MEPKPGRKPSAECRAAAARESLAASGAIDELADLVGADPNQVLADALAAAEALGSAPQAKRAFSGALLAVARAALAAGADPLSRPDGSNTCLELAVGLRDEPLALALARAAGGRLSLGRGRESDFSLFFGAVQRGMGELAEFALEAAPKAKRAGACQKALRWCSDQTPRELVDFLLGRGADPNARDPQGSSMLWLAAVNGARGGLDALLAAAGAALDLRDERGRDAMDFVGGPGPAREAMLRAIEEGRAEWEASQIAGAAAPARGSAPRARRAL